MNDHSGILLKGLDGSNPLAFLAALGTLRTLTLALPEESVRMSWEQHEGAWRPRVWCSLVSDADLLIACIVQQLPARLPSPWTADKRLPFAASLLKKLMIDAANACTMDERASADLLAAFGSEVFTDEKGNFADTSFRMVRSGDSAGQGLLYYAIKNAESTTAEDVRSSLFDRWVYVRGSSFRWDPAEDKMYALQANNPSDDGSLSVVGANRLAVEALALFPVQPANTGAATTGFFRPSPRTEMEFRWPIWIAPLSLCVVASLLTNSILCDHVEARVRRSMGVAAMFKSRQFKLNQYYRNFSPAQAM
jgi:hypothetical protein